MTPPLTPEQRAAYGPDWPDVRTTIAERSGGRCECVGECGWRFHCRCNATGTYDKGTGPDPARCPVHGDAPAERCPALNGQPSPYTGSRVVLTVAHLDHNPGTNEPDRLRHMCQGCHLSYDRNARSAT